MKFSRLQLLVLFVGLCLCILIRLTSALGAEFMEELSLLNSNHYHREMVRLNPLNKGGGLYFQIEDIPFSLKKMEEVINYLPVRMVHIKGESYPVVAETKGSVFGFMKEANLKIKVG